MMSVSAIVDVVPHLVSIWMKVERRAAVGRDAEIRNATEQRTPIGHLSDERVTEAAREAVNRVPTTEWEKLLRGLGFITSQSLQTGYICAHVTGAIAAHIIVHRCIPSERITRELMTTIVMEYTAKYASGTKWAAATVGAAFGGLVGYLGADWMLSKESRPYFGMAVGATVSGITSYCSADKALRDHIEKLVEKLLLPGLAQQIMDAEMELLAARSHNSTYLQLPNSGRLMLPPQLAITEITDMEVEFNQG